MSGRDGLPVLPSRRVFFFGPPYNGSLSRIELTIRVPTVGQVTSHTDSHVLVETVVGECCADELLLSGRAREAPRGRRFLVAQKGPARDDRQGGRDRRDQEQQS